MNPKTPPPAAGPVQPWAAAACWAAFLCPLPSVAWRVAMLAGADVGFGRAGLYRASAGGFTYVVVLELIQVGAALACLGLCRPWGERLPRWVPGVGGRAVPHRLPVIVGGAGNLLLYLIIYEVTASFTLALLRDPPSWTPVEGMGPSQLVVFCLCYGPMLVWPVALTIGLVGHWRRHRQGRSVTGG